MTTKFNQLKKSKFGVHYGAATDRYEWTQTKEEVIIVFPVPEGTRGKDVFCEIKAKHLKAGLKGKPLLIDGPLHQPITTDESTWIIDKNHVEITLTKSIQSSTWWKYAIEGDGTAVDPDKIEGSQYIDDKLLERIEREKQEAEQQKQQQEQKEGSNTEAPASDASSETKA